MWDYRGQKRPDFAQAPGPGQESVWDYPRPPAAAASARRVRVMHDGEVLADTHCAIRVLETASPPSWYVPADDVHRSFLVASPGSSTCEWKGVARYWALAAAPSGDAVAWSYEDPLDAFAMLKGHFGFYPGRVECYVDDERVRPQPGRFYAGWMTDDIAGPVKGEPGTGHW